MAILRRQEKTQSMQQAKGAGKRSSVAYRVLVQPHVTEKAGRLAGLNQYVFRVAEKATKPEIRQAIYEFYGIRPLRVRTSRVPGKRRRLGRTEGWVAGYKKAIVTLPEGKTIEVLPQ